MATNQDNTISRTEMLRTVHELIDQLKDNPVDFDDMGELADLRNVLEQADSAAGNRDGVDYTLIRDDYFERWCEEYASDMGPTTGWPYNCIDWEKAATALQQDYKQVDYDGETYWVRA